MICHYKRIEGVNKEGDSEQAMDGRPSPSVLRMTRNDFCPRSNNSM